MGHGTYEDTHQKILESGLKMFLEQGFERTNLRDLCAGAGITTGSFYRHFKSKEDLFAYFVQPTVDELRKDFSDAEPVCREIVDAGDVRRLWVVMDADRFLDFIYRNFIPLKLLLKCSDGTPYCDFMNEAVRREADLTLRSFRRAKEKGDIPGEIPSEMEMHIFSHAYLSSIFEAVLHDLTREEMEKYLHTIVDFFTAGSFHILGL